MPLARGLLSEYAGSALVRDGDLQHPGIYVPRGRVSAPFCDGGRRRIHELKPPFPASGSRG